MPSLVTEQGVVHYETLGRGRPVLLLHSWLLSWAVWRNSIDVLSQEFRTYALDFFGFGESVDRNSDFSIDNFVQLVDQFMDRMGIPQAAIIGHSMGGTVALAAGIEFPDKFVKTAVVGSPIEGSSLNLLLKLSGNRWFARTIWTTPFLFRLFLRGYAHFIAQDGYAAGKLITTDAMKVSTESYSQSIGTLRNTDLRPALGKIRTPILGVYGAKDRIVDPKQADVLRKYAPTAQVSWFETSGHFPMMDDTDHFHRVILDFLHK